MILMTASQIRALERSVFDGGYLASLEAMERAATAVADVVLARRPEARAALVLCGPGNNGGDGFGVACRLRDAGWAVRVLTWGDPARMTGDAAVMRDRWGALTPAMPEGAIDCPEPVLVDALFGIGLTRPLPNALLVKAEPGAHPWVVAVDCPSGLFADAGDAPGGVIPADLTVTFEVTKPVHHLYPARQWCGEVIVADLGFRRALPSDHPAHTVQPALAAIADPTHWPTPAVTAHKYDRGLVLVASGGLAFTGAARLAARAALRVGAGLVRVLSPPDALAVHAAHLTSIMLGRVDTPDELAAAFAERRAAGLVLGPGFGVGQACRAAVLACLAVPIADAVSPKAIVLDADALTSFADDPATLFAAIRVRRGERADAQTILTPHEGEFARLFPDLVALPSKIDRAIAAAARSGATVLLKGPDTVIAHGSGAYVCTHGTPWLATAGSGDVLAGLIAGLAADGTRATPDAAGLAVWLHGEAGRRLGPGLIAEDLPEIIPAILRDLVGKTPKV